MTRSKQPCNIAYTQPPKGMEPYLPCDLPTPPKHPLTCALKASSMPAATTPDRSLALPDFGASRSSDRHSLASLTSPTDRYSRRKPWVL
jgi:hypothetical protein